MLAGYTYQPTFVCNGAGYFGAVDIIVGSRLVNTRVVRVCKLDKESAMKDANKLTHYMAVMGINCPINIEEFE